MACLGGVTAHAQPSFTNQQIVIGNDPDVQATSINDHGAYTANIMNANSTSAYGFVVNGTTVTKIPNVYPFGNGTAAEAIDNDGNILGYETEGFYSVPHMFLIRGGKLDRNYDLVLVGSFGGQPVQPNPIGFADGRLIFYTEVVSFSAPTDPHYGLPHHLYPGPVYDQFQTARSVNRFGVLAGNDYGLGGNNTVFVGQYPNYTQLLPPGAISAGGGYVNDRNQVAGDYVDTTGNAHGFVWVNGKYTSFDMPTAASKVTVTGISNTGRVVGTYISQTGNAQHAFLYNGKTVSGFDSFSRLDNATVAVNDKSQILLSVQNGRVWRSYLVTCQGTGC